MTRNPYSVIAPQPVVLTSRMLRTMTILAVTVTCALNTVVMAAAGYPVWLAATIAGPTLLGYCLLSLAFARHDGAKPSIYHFAGIPIAIGISALLLGSDLTDREKIVSCGYAFATGPLNVALFDYALFHSYTALRRALQRSS